MPSLFYLLDLDGTVVDSDRLHHEAYAAVLAPKELAWTTFEKAVSESSTEEMLWDMGLSVEEAANARKAKKAKLVEMIADGGLKFMPGAEAFLKHCLDRGINLAIVTNTPKEVVECMRDALPLLRAVPNWITREDYDRPKPNNDCYRLALERFGKGERCVVGVENTLNGFRALKGVAHVKYLVSANGSYTDAYLSDRASVPLEEADWENDEFRHAHIVNGIGEIQPDTGTYSEPHCCCCDHCEERPDKCPFGSRRVVHSGMDRSGRCFIVTEDGEVSLVLSRDKPDLSAKTLAKFKKRYGNGNRS